jgi:hypothetical protein
VGHDRSRVLAGFEAANPGRRVGPARPTPGSLQTHAWVRRDPKVALLAKLGIRPFSYGLIVLSVHPFLSFSPKGPIAS